MKILKVHIRRGDFSKSENQMVYPPRYIAHEVDLNGVGPTSINGIGTYSRQISHGGNEEWCIIILDDALADEYARDPQMEIISEATADALMEQWRIQNNEAEFIVTNPNAITAILAKQQLHLPFLDEDKRALDPTDPIPGINKRLRPIADVIANSGKTFTPITPKPKL